MTTPFPPAATAATLERVKLLQGIILEEQLFDKVWSLVLECGEHERHFGNLQGIYRGLASTWLLAMCGGVGFLLKENIDQKWMLISLVGIATNLGIFVLWVLDILVYHRLLLAVFYDGKQLERACRWLPPSRNRMKSTAWEHAVRKAVALFYVVLILMAAAAALAGAVQWRGCTGWWLTFLPAVLIALICYGTLKVSIQEDEDTPATSRPNAAEENRT